MEIPKIGWFMREDPIEMEDLGVPLFQETSICTTFIIQILTSKHKLLVKFESETFISYLRLSNFQTNRTGSM